MPKYRIPFWGSLLVEADSFFEADLIAHQWTVPVLELTHGVDAQPFPEGIHGLAFCVCRPKIQDVTHALRISIEREKQRQNPIMRQLSINMAAYRSKGAQADWDDFEFYRMSPSNFNVYPDEYGPWPAPEREFADFLRISSDEYCSPPEAGEARGRDEGSPRKS